MQDTKGNIERTQKINLYRKLQIIDSDGLLLQSKKLAKELEPNAYLPAALNRFWNKDLDHICKNALNDGKTSSAKLSLNGPGETLWISATAEPSIEDASVKGLILGFRDITGEMRLQKQKSLNEKMTNISLVAAQIAHEINNPLAAILNRIGCLLVEDLASKDLPNLRAELELLQEQIHSMSIITNSLVAFSEESARHFKIVFLSDIILKSIELCKLLQRNRKIKYEIDIDNHLPPIRGSEITLEQCLINIIRNSIEAMPKGGIIWISTRVDKDLPQFINIEIKDNGIGIPKDNIDKIFDPFYKTKSENHLGLGLSSSYGIIANHNGSMEIKSNEYEGTIVNILLPIASNGKN